MKNRLLLILFLCITLMGSCRHSETVSAARDQADTVGFTVHRWQLDSIIDRTGRLQPALLAAASAGLSGEKPVRIAISPHDDYAYVGYMYPALFNEIRSKVVILIGVGHRAKAMNIEDRLVFGSYTSWKSPAGETPVSGLQDKIIGNLPEDIYVISDTLQAVEHSLEAVVPFIGYFNNNTEIIPVIVPAMSLERMKEVAFHLSSAITKTMTGAGLSWGEGYSIVISSDAAHYGNQGWGGKNYDRFGTDTAGYNKAVRYEEMIIEETFEGALTYEKIRNFFHLTVSDDDFHEYKWTWCGRYSIPVGLLTALNIAAEEGITLIGQAAPYSSSIAKEQLPVEDLQMGTTAPAGLKHWVGYAAAVFR